MRTVIDFGGATYLDDPHKSTIINTRQYRGPEVTLELGWSFPSDVWSVGCLVAESYCGDLLFQTVSPLYRVCSSSHSLNAFAQHEELEHLALMEHMLGRFPEYMSRQSPLGRRYFHRCG